MQTSDLAGTGPIDFSEWRVLLSGKGTNVKTALYVYELYALIN